MKTKELLKQKKLEAQLRSQQIQAKRRPLEESGYVQTQWGKMTAPSRLIDNGHYMKSAEQAAWNFKVEKRRAEKRQEKQAIVLIKKV